MVLGKVWAMITGNETEGQTSPPPPTRETTTSSAPATSHVANRAKDAKKPTPQQVNKPAKKKRAKIPPLAGSQWGALLERCYTYVQADPENNSIRAFCQDWCPNYERRFYDAWREAGLQAFMEQGVPVADPRVQKGIDLVAVKKTEAYVKKRKATTQQPPRDLPKPAKKPRIAHKRHGPRGPYQRLLSGREWADYLEKCYEYHLSATGRPTILAFCDEHCPSRKRTFYSVWNRSGLQEFLADRLPLQDARVQERLQNFIEIHDYNLHHKKKLPMQNSNRKAKSPGATAVSAAATTTTATTTTTSTSATATTTSTTTAAAEAAAAAAATISHWVRQNASAIVDATPIGIAVPIQTEHGDMLSAIKINAKDFILYEDNRLLKITKDDLLDDYRILGSGAMHHPALTGDIAQVLNSPLIPQGMSVIYGDAKYLQANNGAYSY